jgi:cytidylate kinase
VDKKLMKDVITIDGPSGAGKSTVSKLLAQRLGYKYLDTGALYRAVAWRVKELGADPDDEEAVKKILKDTEITFSGDRVMINGVDVGSQIRTREIGELSSRLSAKPLIRAYLFSIQREAGLKGKIVIEGRDIGSTIFPEAENKFFLDASLEERAKRRYKELKNNNPEITMEKTIEDLKKRDLRDSTRKSSPLKKTEDMVYIDTTNLSIEEVVKKIMENLEKVQKNLHQKIKSDRNLFYRFGTLIIRLIFHVNGGLEIKGKDNIPLEGGVIIASNHISYLDPPLISAVLPRRATFMARKGLFDIPLLGWFIRHYAFSVDREKPRPSTIKEAVRRLKNGELIVIFPEGRRSETGELLEPKPGIGMVASLSNVPVVPTLIVGTNKALPVGAKWLKRARISVIFDRPIYCSSTIKGKGSHEEISKKIMSAIKEMKRRYGDNSS